MKSDPILAELYAAKESLAAKYGSDLHALAEAFRHSPAWKPVKRPARLIRTAQRRLRTLTDPGDLMREVRKIKEQIAAENGYDVRKIGAAARKFARKHPLPPAPRTRKSA